MFEVKWITSIYQDMLRVRVSGDLSLLLDNLWCLEPAPLLLRLYYLFLNKLVGLPRSCSLYLSGGQEVL